MDRDSPPVAGETDLGTVSVLIRRAKTGCESSREQLLEQVHQYLMYLAKQKHDPRLAAKVGVSDIVQQSLLKASESFESFRGEHEGQWKAWLKMLLINEVRQTGRHYSRQRRTTSRERPIAGGQSASSDRIHTEPAAPSASPLSEVILSEQLSQLSESLRSLSQDYQTVIRLRTIERKPLADVAFEMNRGVEATAKLWYRAILKLRSTMPDDDTRR